MNYRTQRPRYTGLHVHRDVRGRYQFDHPSDWVATGDDDDDVVVLRPDPEDAGTYFAVWVTDLKQRVTADDLDQLDAGLDDGLGELPGLRVERSANGTYKDIVRLERVVTFSAEPGHRRQKSRIWAVYADTMKYVIAFQGSSVDEYRYWLPMSNNCFSSFQLPLSLWFAADTTVGGAAGHGWNA